ncbi:hypothetical protein HER14_05015 [Acidithiobacillus thiooxidans]|uniref:hypothetical protein n=1 Tax=Acidithiobacillus thiooxidans TaxID=930 RepID=UPI001C0649C5|nr:hypothetical protein [Acidithiobacillus thiooxidans]MBU2750314.1 hypothetical protein [Acidithiobacillus thiooxidans]
MAKPEPTTVFAVRMTTREFAALDSLCLAADISRAQVIKHLVLTAVDPMNKAPDLLLEQRRIGNLLKAAYDMNLYTPLPKQELEALFKFALGNAYRLEAVIHQQEQLMDMP